MTKFLSQKKKLIEDVFEKASNETPEKSFSGIAKQLERSLFDDFKITLSYKTFENYYVKLVENDEDYNIKAVTLDELSSYLGYNNFKEYCAEWKTVEYSVKESISKVVINIVNKPLLKMPEFLSKHSNMGMVGIVLCGSLVAGSKMYKADEKTPEKTVIRDSVFQSQIPTAQNSNIQTVVYVPQNLVSIPAVEENIPKISLKQCMSWDGKEYIPEDCTGTKNGLIAIDMKLVDNFKKITIPDTITERSFDKVWYSKHNNIVEFFTADGKNPENGKELKHLTKHMLETHISPK